MRNLTLSVLSLTLALSGCREPENSVNPTDTGWVTSADTDTGDRPRDAGAADDTGSSGDGPGTPGGGDDTDSGGSADPCNPAAVPSGWWSVGADGQLCLDAGQGGGQADDTDWWGCLSASANRTSVSGVDDGDTDAADEVFTAEGVAALDCACAGHLGAANDCDLAAVLGLSACGADPIVVTYVNDVGDPVEAVCATD